MHWGVGLNKKVVARFYYPKDSADLRLMIGAALGKQWPQGGGVRCAISVVAAKQLACDPGTQLAWRLAPRARPAALTLRFTPCPRQATSCGCGTPARALAVRPGLARAL